MTFTKIDHFAINVTNIDKSITFYTKIIGFKIHFQNTIPNGKRVVYLKLGETILELDEAREGAKNCHFCLLTEDFDTAVTFLEENEVQYAMAPHHTNPRVPTEFFWMRAVFLGPDHEEIEIRGYSHAKFHEYLN